LTTVYGEERTMTHPERRNKVLQALATAGADIMLVSKPANVLYLTGFSGEGLAVVAASEQTALSTDGRYQLDAQRQCPDCELLMHRDGHLRGAIQYVKRFPSARLAFESEVVTHAQYERLCRELGEEKLVPTKGIVEKLRLTKDEAEIVQIQRAAAIVDRALADLVAGLQPGPTEREVALELERAILLGGADAIAFRTIVAAGLSAACPHAVPGPNRLQAGQMVTIDVGGQVNGYCSDMTRTVFLGEPDERFRNIYQTVFQAQAAALDAVRPAIECRELDRIAREVIAAAGYGDYFCHGLGHGVGLEVHEGPRVSARSDAVLEPGMVITIEPGIYIEGWGGVRIEDLLVVTEDGYRLLTGAPKLDFSR